MDLNIRTYETINVFSTYRENGAQKLRCET
jgi:hypothetical protein